MLTLVEKYGANKYSQNGEDGIIAECIKRINPENKSAVEFGGADGFFCSNTRALHDIGWNVYMYDLKPTSLSVIQQEITPENVNELPECSVLSIDIDGNDYAVWKAYEGKPDIVIIEINSSLPPMGEHFSLEKGSSYKTMVQLGRDKGYFLLCHTGNLVFVNLEHENLFPELENVLDPLSNVDDFFNKSWL